MIFIIMEQPWPKLEQIWHRLANLALPGLNTHPGLFTSVVESCCANDQTLTPSDEPAAAIGNVTRINPGKIKNKPNA